MCSNQSAPRSRWKAGRLTRTRAAPHDFSGAGQLWAVLNEDTHPWERPPDTDTRILFKGDRDMALAAVQKYGRASHGTLELTRDRGFDPPRAQTEPAYETHLIEDLDVYVTQPSSYLTGR